MVTDKSICRFSHFNINFSHFTFPFYFNFCFGIGTISSTDYVIIIFLFNITGHNVVEFSLENSVLLLGIYWEVFSVK